MSQINEDIVDQLGGKSHPRLAFAEDGGPRLLMTVWVVGNRAGPGWAAWAGAGLRTSSFKFEVQDQLAAWDGSVFRVLRSRQTSAPGLLLLQCGTRLSSERERILSTGASKLKVLVPHLTAFIANLELRRFPSYLSCCKRGTAAAVQRRSLIEPFLCPVFAPPKVGSLVAWLQFHGMGVPTGSLLYSGGHKPPLWDPKSQAPFVHW